MIEANKRVVMIVDKEIAAGDYSSGAVNAYVMFKGDMVIENMYGNIDPNSCEPRKDGDNVWGFGQEGDVHRGTVKLDALKWPRLYTMNHFRNPGAVHYDSALALKYHCSDNAFNTLFPRERVCEDATTSLSRKPNFIAVDFVDRGETELVVDMLNNDQRYLQRLTWYEGNEATQCPICVFHASNDGTFNFDA